MFGLQVERWEVELVGSLILVACALLWLGFHDAGIKREATAPVIASIQAAEAAASAAATVKAAQVAADQKDALREANSQNASRQADVRALAADTQRMHDDTVRARAALASASASAGSASGIGEAPGMVSTELYIRALEARAGAESDAALMASAVDALGVLGSGRVCTRDYDALR